MAEHRFSALDGMRGVAALAVAQLHAGLWFLKDAPLRTTHLAVDFFFCLSGFVLAYSYADRLAAKSMARRDFGVRRFIRLYPMIFLSILLFLPNSDLVAGSAKFAILAVLSLLMIPAGLPMHHWGFMFNLPVWSLFFEFVASFAFVFMVRWRLAWWAGLAVACYVIVVLTSYFNSSLDGIGFDGWRKFALGFPRVAYPFASGVIVWIIWQRSKPQNVPPILPLAILVVVLALPRSPWAEPVILALIPTLVMLGACARPSRLDRVFNWAGALSYPLYLIHTPLYAALAWLRIGQGPVQFAGAALLAVVAGFAALRLFDEPVRNVLTNRWRARKLNLAAAPL